MHEFSKKHNTPWPSTVWNEVEIGLSLIPLHNFLTTFPWFNFFVTEEQEPLQLSNTLWIKFWISFLHSFITTFLHQPVRNNEVMSPTYRIKPTIIRFTLLWRKRLFCGSHYNGICAFSLYVIGRASRVSMRQIS